MIAAIHVSLHPEGGELVVAAGGNEFCTPDRAQAIAEALRLSQLTGHDVEVELDARLPHEDLVLVCPRCKGRDPEVEIECWAVDGESDIADRAECTGCGHEAHAGLFEMEASRG